MTEKNKVAVAHITISPPAASAELCIPSRARAAGGWAPRDPSSLVPETEIKSGERSDNFQGAFLHNLCPYPVPTSTARGVHAPEAGAGTPGQSQPSMELVYG